MSDWLTIGRLSRRTNLPVSTLRYYERAGLLSPATRTDGNYRLYGEEAVERLRFIKAAQVAGFTLDDIGRLLTIREDGAGMCSEVMELVNHRLAEVETRLRDLEDSRTALVTLLRSCRKSRGANACGTLQELESIRA